MKNSAYQPLEFPACRGERFGHYFLIAMMIPVLVPMAIAGFLTGSYRQALRHAAVVEDYVIAEIIPE